MEPKGSNQSRYLAEYRDFIEGSGQWYSSDVPPEDTLKRYRAQWIRPDAIGKFRRPFSIRLTYVGPQAYTATYVVDIGSYHLSINVLNLPGKVNLGLENLGEGGFGTIVSKQVAEQEFVAKIIQLKEKKDEAGDKTKVKKNKK